MNSFTVTSFGQVFLHVFLVTGLIALVMVAGEWAFAFSIKRAVKCLADAANLYIETKGYSGTVWPLLLFMLGSFAIIVYAIG